MRLSRRGFLRSAAVLGIGSVTTGAATYQYGRRFETGWLDVVRVEIPTDDRWAFLEGLRIVLLSDFHLLPYTQIDFLRRAVAVAATLRPDLAVLTGDFVQQRADTIFDLAPVLASLEAPLGTYCVLGNHDLWRGRNTVRQGLSGSGLPVLDNQGLLLAWSGRPFYLAGVDDCWSGHPDLKAAMAGCPPDTPAVLLSHEPDPADEYARDPRIRLQLSGHSHGGQVRIPGMGSPFLPPYGRKYDMGLYRVGDMWLYTNRGLGVSVPIRLNCRPEVTEIVLTGTAA